MPNKNLVREREGRGMERVRYSIGFGRFLIDFRRFFLTFSENSGVSKIADLMTLRTAIWDNFQREKYMNVE